jgi:hypothetical protein
LQLGQGTQSQHRLDRNDGFVQVKDRDAGPSERKRNDGADAACPRGLRFPVAQSIFRRTIEGSQGSLDLVHRTRSDFTFGREGGYPNTRRVQRVEES